MENVSCHSFVPKVTAGLFITTVLGITPTQQLGRQTELFQALTQELTRYF